MLNSQEGRSYWFAKTPNCLDTRQPSQGENLEHISG